MLAGARDACASLALEVFDADGAVIAVACWQMGRHTMTKLSIFRVVKTAFEAPRAMYSVDQLAFRKPSAPYIFDRR